MKEKLKNLELADIQLILGLFISSIIFFLFREQFFLFICLLAIFQLYLRFLNFSFLVYKALNQAKLANSLVSLKILVSAVRGIITAFLIFLALKYFGLNYVLVLTAVLLVLASMVVFGILKNC